MCRVVWWECFCEKFLSNFLPCYSSLSFWERHKATDTVESLTHFLALYNPLHPPPLPQHYREDFRGTIVKDPRERRVWKGVTYQDKVSNGPKFWLRTKNLASYNWCTARSPAKKNCTGHVNYFSRGNILQVKRKDPFQGNFKF